MAKKKKKPYAPRLVVSEVDPKLLLECRKVLFSTGVSFQRFLGFMLERMSVRDERVMSILSDAHSWKNRSQVVENINDFDHIYSVLESRFHEHRKEIRKGELYDDEKDAQKNAGTWNEDG